jgi:hypothetical protein
VGLQWHGTTGEEPIRERILDVKDQRKRNRYLGGTAPFGWQLGEDATLIEVPELQL